MEFNNKNVSADKQSDITMTAINGLKARFFKSLNETFNPKATIAIIIKRFVMKSSTFIIV